MRHNWLSVGIWSAILVAAPVVVAAILTLNGWPIGNTRILLLFVFAVEIFIILVPPTWYAPGRGPTGVSVSGPMRQPTYDEFMAAADMRLENLGKRLEIDPIVLGPAIALVVLLLSLLFAR